MRILVVSNLYPPVVRGGYELECALVVRLLRLRGDDVRVLTTRAKGIASDEPFVARELHEVPRTRRAFWAAALTAASGRRIARAHLREFQPDLAFVWNGAEIPHATIYEILSSGTPTAFRVMEHWFGGLFSKDYFMSYLSGGGSRRRRTWSAAVRGMNTLPFLRLRPSIEAEVAICWVSDFLRGAVRVPEGLRPRLECVVHPTTHRATDFEALQRRPSSTPIVAYAGRLSEEKGVDVAIAAIGRLSRKGRDVRLIVAGPVSSEDYDRLRETAEREKVLSQCTFTGRLETQALGDLFATASVLVIPSVWQEPLPITAIEGALARIPIVAARSGGIPEALADGEEALLTTPGDADELADAIETVLTRPEEADRRAAQAFNRWRARSAEMHAEAMCGFVDAARGALSAP